MQEYSLNLQTNPSRGDCRACSVPSRWRGRLPRRPQGRLIRVSAAKVDVPDEKHPVPNCSPGCRSQLQHVRPSDKSTHKQASAPAANIASWAEARNLPDSECLGAVDSLPCSLCQVISGLRSEAGDGYFAFRHVLRIPASQIGLGHCKLYFRMRCRGTGFKLLRLAATLSALTSERKS